VKRDYELGFILSPEVSEEETRSILGRLEQIAAQYGGQVVKVNQWGRRRLAYPIERHRDGYYVFIDMILTPETVIELERTLRVSEIVLRHMLIKRDAKVAQKEREEREEREARSAAKAEAEAEQAVQSEEETSQEPVSVPELPSDELADAPATTDNSETVEA
jgi:small subunit ribosomal protein S6